MFPTAVLIPIAIVTIVFFFVYLMVRQSSKERDEKRRLELIDRALEHGQIDPDTKRALLGAVVHRKERRSPLLVVGWLGMCTGVGMLLMVWINPGGVYYKPETWHAAIMITAISFGMLSLPIATRELSRGSERNNPLHQGDS